jgi:hypothetical protein
MRRHVEWVLWVLWDVTPCCWVSSFGPVGWDAMLLSEYFGFCGMWRHVEWVVLALWDKTPCCWVSILGFVGCDVSWCVNDICFVSQLPQTASYGPSSVNVSRLLWCALASSDKQNTQTSSRGEFSGLSLLWGSPWKFFLQCGSDVYLILHSEPTTCVMGWKSLL